MKPIRSNTANRTIASAIITASDPKALQLEEVKKQILEIQEGNQFNLILPLAQKALALSQELNNYADIAQMLRLSAVCYIHLGKKSEATTAIQEAEHIANSLNDESELGRIFNAYAIIYTAQGFLTLALEYQYKSYEIKKRLSDKISLAYTLHEIGELYMRMRKFSNAIEVLNEALSIKKNHGTDWTVATTLHSLGLALIDSGMVQEGISYLLQCLEIKERYPKNELSFSFTLQALAKAYMLLEEYQLSNIYLQRAIEIKRKHYDIGSLIRAYVLQSKLLLKMDNIKESMEVGEFTYNLCISNNSIESLIEIHQHLAECYEKTGNFTKAIHHIREYALTKEKVISGESRIRFEEVSAELQLQQSQHKAEVERLRSEQLQLTIDSKNRDLTAQALNIAQKNEMLSKLYKHINEQRNKDVSDTNILNSVERQIQTALRSENLWLNFEEQFTLLHHDFIKDILALYPSLSPMEVRLCSLLILHLSSKEIANMLSITPKSVEVYRTRLRKKLSIPPEIGLINFLIGLKK